jgi:hypothetical protein
MHTHTFVVVVSILHQGAVIFIIINILTNIEKENFEAHSFINALTTQLKNQPPIYKPLFYLEIEKSLHPVITTEKDTS